MSVKKFRCLRANRINKKKILILSALFFSFFFISFINDLNINQIFNQNEQSFKDVGFQNLDTQALSVDNTFSSIGAPWDVSHWANRTDYNIPVEFENATSYTVDMELGSGWEGYQLNGTIKDLYDTRNWVNGTFHEGPDDGNDACPEDDSNDVLNWTYNYIDFNNTNYMSGNYFNSTSDPSGTGNDCLELQIQKSGNLFDMDDRCLWDSSFKIPRGKVIGGDLYLSVYPHTVDTLANVFSLEIYINDEFIYGIGLYTIQVLAGGPNWVDLLISLEDFLDNSKIFPNPINNTNMNITVQLRTLTDVPANVGNIMGSTERILFDNVSIVLQTEVKPELLGLKMNNLPVSDIDWGNGTVGQVSTWTTTPVDIKFDTSEVRPPEMGGYEVEFKTDLNLFAKKMNDKSDYKPNFDGVNFEVSNNSDVEWETYARVSVPTGYEETNMTLVFPEDVNITWISNAEYPNTNILKYCDNSTLGILKVFNFSETPDGFWWVKGKSPNYCSDLKIYNNATTGSWILDNTFYSGEYINITAEIGNSVGCLDISHYIENTEARLYLRFPNGTIWSTENQIKPVTDTGMVYFDPILIPSDEPNYEVGNYHAIVTWNNSYSGFNLNETGLIYKTFTINHNSTLIPDEYYYTNIYEGDTVNLKVTFYDPKNDKPIEDANVYLTNFTGGTQYFDEINPGYYLLIFNTSGGDAGDNNLTIYATHPSYQNNEVNITIEVIYYTSLTAEEYLSIEVPWNNNVTIHLNYTVTSDDSGIENANPTVYWNGDWSIKSGSGLYNLTCNNSKYQVNTAPNLRIELDKVGYETQTIIISIEVVERDTYIDEIFINTHDCTANKSYNIQSGDLMNITVKYKDNNAGGSLIHDAMVTLNGTSIGEIFTDNINFYNLTLNTTQLSIGIYFLNIIAYKDNYTAITELLTINVYQIETDLTLFIDDVDVTSDPSINRYRNEIINVTVSYDRSIPFGHIPGANVDINGSGVSELLPEAFNNYSVLINTNELSQGANFLTIFARKIGYEAHSISLVINIIQIETNLTLFIDDVDVTSDPSINRYPNESFNITVSYDRSIPFGHIPGAIVDINGSGVSELLPEAFNNYSVLINTNNLSQGANFLTIFAQKVDYEPQSILLVINIIQIETDLSLFVDGEDVTSDPSITRYPNEILNITISYDRSIPFSHVPGATVDINGSGVSELLDEAFNNYSVLINTNDLNQGANFLTIYARKNGYEPQTILLVIQIIQIETDLSLFIDGEDVTSDPSITRYPNEILNITISYDRSIPFGHIPGATVDINGSGVSEFLPEVFDNYSVLINTNDLNQGANFLTIYARKNGYEPQTILLVIQIIQIETDLSLFIDGEDVTSDPSITRYPNEILNITVSYDRSIPFSHVPGATVDINGSRVSEFLPEAFDNYSVLIDTNDLNQGANFLTIYARKNGYEPQTILLVIQIIQIETDLTLFINGYSINDGDTIQVETDDLLNITVYYRNNETKEPLAGAKIDLVGRGQLNQTNDYYNITINAFDLEQGITILTIFAQLANYEPQTIQFFVKVVERSTKIQLFINGVDKTLEKIFDVTIGQTLNITIRYTDNQTGDYITGALVQLEGEGLTLNFTRDDILEQHYLILDTRDLGIGVKLFSIIAQANNYKIQPIDPRITVKRIGATINLISGGSQIETEVGEDVLIQINLNNTVFGGLILNATVTYRWAYSQGELEDPDNNGIYETTLENVPVGVFQLTITAFAGDDYDFETAIITLVVNPSESQAGPDLSWLVYVLVGAIAGLTVVFTLYQMYFKYPPMVRKIRKLKKKVKKAKKTKPIIVNKRDEIINKELQDRIKMIEYGVIQPEKIDKIEKTRIKVVTDN